MPEKLLDRTAALAEAIMALGSKKELLDQLNKRGHGIRSHNVVSQWLRNGVPAKYCPDIEALTGVSCERLCPDVNWGLVRDRRSTVRKQKKGD
jgi:DNA-binding transcriptional regulator YdaS (Cro superfamily)